MGWNSVLFTLKPLLSSSLLLAVLYITFCLVSLFLGVFSCSEQHGFLEHVFHYDSPQLEEKILQLLCAHLSPVCDHLCVEGKEEREFILVP